MISGVMQRNSHGRASPLWSWQGSDSGLGSAPCAWRSCRPAGKRSHPRWSGAAVIRNHLNRVKPERVDGEYLYLSLPSPALWDTWKREGYNPVLEGAIEAVVGVRYQVALGQRPQDDYPRVVFSS